MPAEDRSQPDHAHQPARRPRRRTYAAGWLDDLGHLDLRRPRDAEAADRVIHRADWLGPSDRALVLAVFRDSMSVTDLARAHDTCPRSLRRRLAAALARINDDHAPFVIAHTTTQLGPPAITGVRARIARAVYLQGRSMRAIADDLGVSLHTVRAHRQAVDALYDAWKHQGSPVASLTKPANPNRSPDRTWR